MVNIMGRKTPTPSADVGNEHDKVRNSIVMMQAEVAAMGSEQEEAQRQADEARFNRDVLGQNVKVDESRADAISAEIAKKLRTIDQAKRYLARLDRPLLEARERELIVEALPVIEELGQAREDVLDAFARFLDAREKHKEKFELAFSVTTDLLRVRRMLGDRGDVGWPRPPREVITGIAPQFVNDNGSVTSAQLDAARSRLASLRYHHESMMETLRATISGERPQ